MIYISSSALNFSSILHNDKYVIKESYLDCMIQVVSNFLTFTSPTFGKSTPWTGFMILERVLQSIPF